MNNSFLKPLKEVPVEPVKNFSPEKPFIEKSTLEKSIIEKSVSEPSFATKSPSETSILEIQNLTVAIEKNHQNLLVLKNLNFSLFDKEILAIVGESGCGKSFTALSLIQLLPQNAKIISGKILFREQIHKKSSRKGKEKEKIHEIETDLVQKKPKELLSYRGSKISMIFQDPMSALNPTMRIGRQVEEALHKTSLTKKQKKEKVQKIFHLVGLEKKNAFSLYPHQLSGGMRQRVMIAIAIASSAKVLIADEPTSSLDKHLQNQILSLFLKIRESQATSIIIITHDLLNLSHIADRIIVMYGGYIVEVANTKNLLSSPKHPYTKMLLQSAIHLSTQKLVPIEGTPPSPSSSPKGCPFAPRCPFKKACCLESFPSCQSHVENHISYCFFSHSSQASYLSPNEQNSLINKDSQPDQSSKSSQSFQEKPDLKEPIELINMPKSPTPEKTPYV